MFTNFELESNVIKAEDFFEIEIKEVQGLKLSEEKNLPLIYSVDF